MKIRDLFEQEELAKPFNRLKRLKKADYTKKGQTRYGFGDFAEYHSQKVRMMDILKGSKDRMYVMLLSDLFVDEDKRGNGIGSNMIRRFITQSQIKGMIATIITDVDSKAYPLYVRLGFTDIGVSKHGGKSRVLAYLVDDGGDE